MGNWCTSCFSKFTACFGNDEIEDGTPDPTERARLMANAAERRRIWEESRGIRSMQEFRNARFNEVYYREEELPAVTEYIRL